MLRSHHTSSTKSSRNDWKSTSNPIRISSIQFARKSPSNSYFLIKKGQCKPSLDPTVDEVKKTCLSLRHQIKQDRLLFHYNGHGVPKPTQNGELWVFNKVFPFSLFSHLLELHPIHPSVYLRTTILGRFSISLYL